MCWNNGWGGNGCLWIILILILICCCGCGTGGNSCGCGCNNNNCGCGNNVPDRTSYKIPPPLADTISCSPTSRCTAAR